MILTDTGPIIALLDRNDPNHKRCLAAAQSLLAGPLLTTLPCFTEAMYFVEKEGGYLAQKRLWLMQETGRLMISPWNEEELQRANILMGIYRDIPMDLADASLVAAAEARTLTQIFTLDRHFYAYQICGNTPFHILPG